MLEKVSALSDEDYEGFSTEIKRISEGFEVNPEHGSKRQQADALASLVAADLSGLKKYREKMGLTKQELLDLVQVSEDASYKDKGTTWAVKKLLQSKDFRGGGVRQYEEGGEGKEELSKMEELLKEDEEEDGDIREEEVKKIANSIRKDSDNSTSDTSIEENEKNHLITPTGSKRLSRSERKKKKKAKEGDGNDDGQN